MKLFYAPDILRNQVLPEEESGHAVRVLRLQSGDNIEVVDGAGGFYKAVIANPHPKRCSFEIIEKTEEFGKRDFKLHMAIAPTNEELRVGDIPNLFCAGEKRPQKKCISG